MPILFALALRHPEPALALILSGLAGLSIGLAAGLAAGIVAFAVSAALTTATWLLRGPTRRI